MSHKSLRTLIREAGNKQMIHNLGSNCWGSNKFKIKLKAQTRELLEQYDTDTPEGMEEFVRDYYTSMAEKSAGDRARVAARVAAKPKKDKKGKKNRKPKK
jgi:hypothetical protein